MVKDRTVQYSVLPQMPCLLPKLRPLMKRELHLGRHELVLHYAVDVPSIVA